MSGYSAVELPHAREDDFGDPREDGFYWVRVGQNQPEIGCWQRHEWWFCGDDRSWRSGAVEVLSERLERRPAYRLM